MKDKSFTQLKKEIYLRDVARRWKSELKNTDKKVYILSPYITSKIEDIVKNIKNPKDCDIYTTFEIENFLFGSSSLKTLKSLFKKKFNLYSVPKLHAKIVLVSGNFVSIGSQNLTNQGTKNKEATFTSTSSAVVKFVESALEEWTKNSKEISLELIDELEKSLADLKKLYKHLKKKVEESEKSILEREEQRETERQEAIEREKRIRENRDRIRQNLKQIRKTEFIKGSVTTSSDYGRYTFIPSSNPDLLNWRIGKNGFSLSAEHKRYLSLFEDIGKLGWARVNKTCITFFEGSVGHSELIQLQAMNYKIAFFANWDVKTLSDYNLIITLKGQNVLNISSHCKIYTKFYLNELEIVKIENINTHSLTFDLKVG